MARKSLTEILRYLKPFTRYEGIELHEFKFLTPIHDEFPTYDKFKEILIERFKRSPSSERSTSDVSLYERLGSSNALEAILSKSVIEEIQSSLEIFEIEERLRAKNHLSTRNFSDEFHRSVLRAIHGHILHLHTLSKRFEVRNEWFSDYIPAGHKQMLREVRAMFPMYPFGGPKDRPTSRARSANDLVYAVYSTLEGVLRHRGIRRGRKELSIQLTAAFCTRSDFFSSGFSPAAVKAKLDHRK